MLTKEEVLDIISYCNQNGVQRKDRLAQLGISAWMFYKSRRFYLKDESESGEKPGSFIELSRCGFVPATVTEMEKAVNPRKVSFVKPGSQMQIECQTPRGGLLRITGDIAPSVIFGILQNI